MKNIDKLVIFIIIIVGIALMIPGNESFGTTDYFFKSLGIIWSIYGVYFVGMIITNIKIKKTSELDSQQPEDYIDNEITKRFRVIIMCLGIVTMILGIVTVIIPQFENVPIIAKIWFLLLVASSLVPLLTLSMSKLKNIKEINKIESLNRKEIENHQYYRDILNNYSSGILSFVYNRKINYADTLVATILELKKDKFINIDDNGINILKNEINNLSVGERVLMQKLLSIIEINKVNKKISYGELINIFSSKEFIEDFKTAIKSEAKEKGLYLSKVKTYNIVEKIKHMPIIFILLFPFILAFIIIFSEVNLVAYIIGLIASFIFLIVYTQLNKYKEENIFIRTKSGIDIQNKLAGLKNYIKDFSVMRDRKIEEIALWDDYLIYAIIFDLKGNLDKEAYELYKMIGK